MKATGIVRQIDDLGRVVMPKELRRTLSMVEKDSVEFYVDGEFVIIKKYQPGCTFCDSVNDVKHFKGKLVCKNCVDELS